MSAQVTYVRADIHFFVAWCNIYFYFQICNPLLSITLRGASLNQKPSGISCRLRAWYHRSLFTGSLFISVLFLWRQRLIGLHQTRKYTDQHPMNHVPMYHRLVVDSGEKGKQVRMHQQGHEISMRGSKRDCFPSWVADLLFHCFESYEASYSILHNSYAYL